jgi:plasmid stabilization system protein ParE
MTLRHTLKLTDQFEQNLEEIEAFLSESATPQAFDALIDELEDVITPNLERFPNMGRLFLERPTGSVETSNGIARLIKKQGAMIEGGELREYITPHYLLLYAVMSDTVYLLSIRHHRQLSFDLGSHWPS